MKTTGYWREAFVKEAARFLEGVPHMGFAFSLVKQRLGTGKTDWVEAPPSEQRRLYAKAVAISLGLPNTRACVAIDYSTIPSAKSSPFLRAAAEQLRDLLEYECNQDGLSAFITHVFVSGTPENTVRSWSSQAWRDLLKPAQCVPEYTPSPRPTYYQPMAHYSVIFRGRISSMLTGSSVKRECVVVSLPPESAGFPEDTKVRLAAFCSELLHPIMMRFWANTLTSKRLRNQIRQMAGDQGYDFADNLISKCLGAIYDISVGFLQRTLQGTTWRHDSEELISEVAAQAEKPIYGKLMLGLLVREAFIRAVTLAESERAEILARISRSIASMSGLPASDLEIMFTTFAEAFRRLNIYLPGESEVTNCVIPLLYEPSIERLLSWGDILHF